MSHAQKTLHEYHNEDEFREEDMNMTVVFVLKKPTKRKRERIERAMEDAAQIREKAADRMMGAQEKWSLSKTADVWHT